MKRTCTLVLLFNLCSYGYAVRHRTDATPDFKGAAGDNKRAAPATPTSNPTIPPAQASAVVPDAHQPAKEKPLAWYLKPEWASVWVTGLYTVIAGLTLAAIKRQADVMEKQSKDAIAASVEAKELSTSILNALHEQAQSVKTQATYMVDSERPFIVVETLGANGNEFWIRNCGKSPAQILFVDPLLVPEFPEWDQRKQEFALPAVPQYGPHYYEDQWEQINVQWLGPGDKRCFATFEPEILKMQSDTLRAEINQGLRGIRLYSSVKYRGMFSPSVYHSRFCYGWGPTGTYMTGPLRYNEYT